MNLDDLEARLGRLDLRLDGGGAHLGDERIAELCAGAEPTEAEAGHLAGCDACVELLVALGEGLEALAMDEPALGALMAEAPRPARRRPARWTTVALLLVAGAAAAAAGYIARQSAPPPAPAESAPPRAGARGAAPEVPILPTEAVLERQAPGESPAGEPAERTEAAPPPVEPPAPPIAPLPAPPITPLPAPSAVGAEATAEPARPARRPRRAPRDETAPRLPFASPDPGALEPREGPRPLERRPVDGPPRGFGYLQLATRPPARVFVDGTPRGWTPIIDLRLPEGPHDVRLEFDSPLAAEKEQRFRVLIEPDRTWRITRDNVK